MTRTLPPRSTPNPEFTSTPEDDKRILDGVMAGDTEAGREFVQRWGRLARHFGRIAAERTRTRTGTGVVDEDDMTQEMFLNMLQNAPNYQLQEDGAKFSSYISSYMPSGLDRVRFAAEHGVHVSENARVMLGQIDAANDARIRQGRPYLSDVEIAEMFHIPLNPGDAGGRPRVTVFDLNTARGLSKFMGSIDKEGFAPNQDESPGQGYEVSEVRPMNSVTADVPRTVAEEAEGNDLREKMDTMLATLGDRERAYMKQLYGYDDNDPKTLDEIAAEAGLPRERIRQIVSKAHAKLRRHPELVMGMLLDD